MHMREVAQGQHAKHVSFRKGDYFPELSEAYNMQIDRLAGQEPQPGRAPESERRAG
jgi:hypothetical protein